VFVWISHAFIILSKQDGITTDLTKRIALKNREWNGQHFSNIPRRTPQQHDI
jgi:hypothetical protein